MMLLPSAWQFWVVAGVLLCAVEMLTPGFVALWLGIGALAAALPAALELPLWTQLAAFTATSIALFASSRTIFKRVLMRDATRIKTNVEAMVGAEAVVVDPVPDSGTGTVRINGELWAARSLTGALTAGECAVVERVDGLKLHVRRPGVRLRGSREE